MSAPANPLLLPELRAMIAEGDIEGLRTVMNELHAASVADFAEGLTTIEAWELLRHAEVPRQADVFAFFSPEKQVELVEGGGRQRMSALLEAMPHDDRVDLLQRVDPQTVDNLLPLVAKADREDIRRLLSYPEHSVGSVMTTDYATLPPDITVQEALQRLRQEAPHRETIYIVYVIDDERRLIGSVSLRDLILARPTALVRDIMTDEVVAVRADQDQEEVARQLAKYDFLAVPVVDDERHLLGIVTHDDVLDVLVEEATEDALHMAGVGAMADNYLKLPFATVWRKRASWLACLFVAELFTFTALSHYEDAIASIIALSLFVPLCISTGGNSGSQAATLITRAMALGQITPSGWWHVLRHELGMGLALGLTLGVIGFVRGATTPQSILDGATTHPTAFEVETPGGAELPLDRHAFPLPSGARVLNPPLAAAAVVHLPSGAKIERLEMPGAHGAAVYRFPPNSEVRYPMPIRWRLAAVISLSVASICLWGTLVGSMLPLVFRQLGFDPGYASTPFVATFVDVTGIVVYFSVARVFLL